MNNITNKCEKDLFYFEKILKPMQRFDALVHL